MKSITESIISGYGVGPTDENGRPLFGLKALRTSGETKFTEEDLDGGSKTRTDYTREVVDNSGRPMFGIKALQRKSTGGQHSAEQNVSSSFSNSSETQTNSSDKFKDYHTVTSESSSRVYSTRTAMKSDSSGNVSILQDEIKGEIHSKDGKEPAGKMITTRYSYQKPEGGEATIKTKTTTSILNAKDDTNSQNLTADKSTASRTSSRYSPTRDAQKSSSNLISDNGGWKTSSSLIRKISNEHFEKAQRKFSGDKATLNGNEDRQAATFESKSETRNKSYSKVDSSSSFSTRYSSESTDTKRRSYDESSNANEYHDFRRSSPVSVGCSYEENSSQTVGRSNSFKDIKNKFQQATVSSSLKQVPKSPSGRESPTKFKADQISADESSSKIHSNHSGHGTKTSSYETSQSFESTSVAENKISDVQDLLNRIKTNFNSRSEYKDEDKEAVSLLNKYVHSSSVSLRELDRIPKSTDSSQNSSISIKATSFNKTKQSKDEINVDQIWDENQLRNLLEACTDYENRRLIRARLRTIMAENKANVDVMPTAADNADIAQKNETSETTNVATSKSESFSSCTKVNNKTSSTSRTVKVNSVTASPFAKFRQLERQHSLPSSGGPIYKYTKPHLARSATTIKDRLLNWVKAQTKDYKNVQIDNFSTSWNNGLAFCALIHHFCPHAFDYNKLTPEQRRHNFELAFKVAEEEAGIVPLLDVEDMVVMTRPDWKCVFTYVQSVYQRFHATPEAVRPQ